MVYVVLNMFSIGLLKRACNTECLCLCLVFAMLLGFFSSALSDTSCHANGIFHRVDSGLVG